MVRLQSCRLTPALFHKTRSEAPVLSLAEILCVRYRPLLRGVGVAILYVACAYGLFVNMPTFAVRQLALPFSQALIATAVASGIVFVCSPLAAAISDRYGRKPLLIVGALAFALATYPAFILITPHHR